MGDGSSSITVYFAVAFLLLLSAFFSSSETSLFAYYSILKTPKKRRKRDRKKENIVIRNLLKEPSKLLTAIIFGNLIVNILASSILEEILGIDNFFLSVIMVTAILLVVGEITPKVIAVNFYERVASFNARIMRVFMPVLSVLIKPFELITNFVLSLVSRVFFKERKRKDVYLNIDKLARIIEQSEFKLNPHQRELIDNVLKISRIKAAEVMTPRPNVVHFYSEDSLYRVVDVVRREPHTYYPVFKTRSEDVMGVLALKKILPVVVSSGSKPSVKRWMRLVDKAKYYLENETLLNLLLSFKKEKKKVGVIVDEYGGMVGIITLSDLLEAIVGGMMEEEVRAKRDFEVKLENGKEVYIVDGTMPIVRFNEKIGADFNAEGYASVGGLILKKIQDVASAKGDVIKMPEKGDEFVLGDYKFTVIEADEKQIKKIKVEKMKTSKSIANHQTYSSRKNSSRV